MKRLVCVMVALICIPFSMLSCRAVESDFYCTYTAKSEKSSFFYIDVYCSRAVSAAVFELAFDSGRAEYREAETAVEDSKIRGNTDGNKATFAFVCGGAGKGRLCRLTFKTLQSGDCTFTLHMKQACDGNLQYINDLPDSALSVTLGKESLSDSSSSGSSNSSGSSEKSAGKSYGAESSKSVVGEDVQNIPEEEDEDSNGSGGLVDLKDHRALTYILIGAGSVITVAALIFFGFLIGKRVSAKGKKAEDDMTDDAFGKSDEPSTDEGNQ